jgi:hypothetical protein
MYLKLSYIQDTFGSNYIGANIPIEMAMPYLEKLKVILEDEYEEFTNIQKSRDKGKYHITVINVMEYNMLSKKLGMDKFINSLEPVFDFDFDDIKFMGIGMAEKNDNKAYFIVVKSEQFQEVRKKYGLPEQDFHITLGMKWKDVFGVRKNQVIPEVSTFLKLLKKEYFENNETFDFIKSLPYFDETNQEVLPIKIDTISATFVVGDKQHYTVSLLDDKLAISAKWSEENEKPILSNTLIYRIMNKK